MSQALKQLHQGYRFLNPDAGLGSKPNVYRRSMAPMYLSLEQKAAGVDEPLLLPLQRRVWVLAVSVLTLVLLCVGLWVN